VRERFEAYFKVDVERLSITLAIGKSRREAAVDQDSVKAEGRSIPVNELELELKKGEKLALFELARAFCRNAPLRLSFISKAELGYLLADGAWGQALKATQTQLAADMNCRGLPAEIFCLAILGFHLGKEFLYSIHVSSRSL
jgi:inorganic triphosphatase YgiF